MRKREPTKEFIPAPPNQSACSCNECPFMKLNTLEKILACLETGGPEIVMSEELRTRALVPLQRMLDWSA